MTSLLPISGDHYKNQKLEEHLDAQFEPNLHRYSQQKHDDLRIPEAPIARQTYPTRY